MKILAISGSASRLSSNYYLLQAIANLWKDQAEVEVIEGLEELSLFSPKKLETCLTNEIKLIKEKISTADLVMFATPEYSHNIPACLKNLLEWCTASGEFHQKKVIPITFTPHEPRGTYAMQSLLMSLQALKARILVQVALYKTEVNIDSQAINLPEEIQDLFLEALKMSK